MLCQQARRATWDMHLSWTPCFLVLWVLSLQFFCCCSSSGQPLIESEWAPSCCPAEELAEEKRPVAVAGSKEPAGGAAH